MEQYVLGDDDQAVPQLRGFLLTHNDWHDFAKVAPALGMASWDAAAVDVATWLSEFPDGAVVTVTVEVPKPPNTGA